MAVFKKYNGKKINSKHPAYLIVSGALTACQNALNTNESNIDRANTEASNTTSNSDRIAKEHSKNGSHEHTAPHGGTLIAFGEEFAHLELVLDSKSGQLTAYVPDGEAEKSIPLAQEIIEIEVEKPEAFNIRLEAVENELTGEKRGATSEFRVVAEELKGQSEFDAAIRSLTVRGREFKKVHFNFPQGNEDGHEH